MGTPTFFTSTTFSNALQMADIKILRMGILLNIIKILSIAYYWEN